MNENIETKVEKLRPFTKILMTIGELPTSYLMSMTYYEQVLWFTKYLQDKVIPAINNNASALEEVQNLVIELQHYLDNLDLQEEVNNKLDEMAESGELEEIISQYLNSTAIFGFDNVESMKQATNLINGSYAKTIGYYSKNDGGGNEYYISDVASESNYQENLENGLYAIPIKNKSTRKLQQPIYGYLWLPEIPVEDQKINVRNYKLNGFNGFIICLHIDYINNNFVLRENLSDIIELCQYSIRENMEINSIKFHYVPGEEEISENLLNQYYLSVLDIMNSLKTFTTNIYIFNEANYINGFKNKVNEIITSLKEFYNVGISFNIGSLRITDESTLNLLDYVGYNYYPRLSSQGKYSETEFMQEACNNNGELNMIFYLISLFGKDKVNVTETGIRDYYVYLREPSNYMYDSYIEHNDGAVVKLYYDIVLNTLNGNVNSIATWFKTLYDSTYEFWTEWTGGIK